MTTNTANTSTASAVILLYEIIRTETLKKGGQLQPLIKPKYDLIFIEAALTQIYEDLNKADVESTLRSILSGMVELTYGARCCNRVTTKM